MVTIIAFVTVLVIVYVVRRLEVEYAWHIAVFGGGIAYMIIMAAGGIFLEATIPVVHWWQERWSVCLSERFWNSFSFMWIISGQNVCSLKMMNITIM